MTIFYANTMTSNIQHGMTSHYRRVSRGAIAKSLERTEIVMGCSICAQGLHSGFHRR